MSADQKHQLKQELRAAGASSDETDSLLLVAAKLKLLGFGKQFYQKPSYSRLFRPVSLVLSGAVLGMILIMYVQSVQPTSWLYPMQKLSDSVAIAADPSFRANVMMKRAQQVSQLVNEHASSNKIMATLSSYNQVASVYRYSSYPSYAAFEYCKTNLNQAMNQAKPAVRHAIYASLQSLQSI